MWPAHSRDATKESCESRFPASTSPEENPVDTPPLAPLDLSSAPLPDRKSRRDGFLRILQQKAHVMRHRTEITSISIRGFKTLDRLEDFRPGPLNILIGANGAGKSNFIAFFRLLSWMIDGKLQEHVGRLGGASKLLFEGPARTRELECSISIRTESGENGYQFRLGFASGDQFVFLQEQFRFTRTGFSPHRWTDLKNGHRESNLAAHIDSSVGPGKGVARYLRSLLKSLCVYQFHNTSDTARVKQRWRTEDKWFLKEDGGNLAPVLLRLREEFPPSYQKVVAHCRQLLPFFDDFVLNPEHDHLLLQWRERKSDLILDAAAASDGMLRIFALITLLCHPPDELPDVLLMDEPELGLHPAAIELIGGLIRSASAQTQIIAATQSPMLLNQFDPEQVTVVERDGGASQFKRLDAAELSGWLEDYSLAELWQKNVLGGRPSR